MNWDCDPHARPIAVGIHEDHNGGLAALRGGRVLVYSEWERHTRRKNQGGWWPELIAGQLSSLPVHEIGAISCPRPEAMRDLLCQRLGGRPRADGTVDLGGPPVRLLHQDDLHPELHFLSTLLLPEVQPGVYMVIIFDAARPQIGWADLREPLRAIPDLQLAIQSEHPWYVGDIFASFFGAMFYSRSSIESCGKLMGMAAWGRTSVGRIQALGRLADTYFDRSLPPWQGYARVESAALNQDVRATFQVNPFDHRDSRTLDLAAAAQELFRHELAAQVERGTERVRQEMAQRGLPPAIGVLYAGGCALSVVTNEAIRRIVGLPLIVPPFSHDAGQFVGGAVHAALVADQLPLPLGRGWDGLPCHSSGRIIPADLRAAGCAIHETTPDDVAQRIQDGQLIACLGAGAEAGPRALGNRSLLANAQDRGMRDRINMTVKRREWYRPFAPMLPTDAFADLFAEHATPAARYMLDSFCLRPEQRDRFAGVSSPDGVSRPQAVDAATSPFLSRLLHETGRRSGFPVLLNTSLNAPGLPIAHGLDQCLHDCRVLGLDAAVLHADTDPAGSPPLLIDLKE